MISTITFSSAHVAKRSLDKAIDAAAAKIEIFPCDVEVDAARASNASSSPMQAYADSVLETYREDYRAKLSLYLAKRQREGDELRQKQAESELAKCEDLTGFLNLAARRQPPCRELALLRHRAMQAANLISRNLKIELRRAA